MDLSDALLGRYFAGEVTREEHEGIERSLAADPGLRARVDLLRRAWVDARPTDVAGARIETLWARIASGLHEASRTNGHTSTTGWHNDRTPTPRSRVLQGLSVAAAAVLIVGISFPLMRGFWRSTPSTSQLTSQARRYVTGVGQRAVVRLADNVVIIMAPRTVITLEETGREPSLQGVSLVGEAYFEVGRHTRAPFVVKTGHITTRVLGTAFDVRRYADDQAVRVAVVSGKVQSGTSTSSVTLTAGMLARVVDSGATMVTASDVTPYTDWTHGHLTFRTAPLPEVLAVLEQWYGIRFRMGDSTLQRATLSGRFDFETTAELLQALKASLAVSTTYQRIGDTTIVTLHAQPSRAPQSHGEGSEPMIHMHKEVGR